MMGFAHRALIGFATWLPVISLIITVHELGHFLVARAFGVLGSVGRVDACGHGRVGNCRQCEL